MNSRKFSIMAVLATLVLATPSAAPLFAEDLKRIGGRYRLKVTSAGIPSLGAVMNGYKVRTKYHVFNKSVQVGEAYLGDPVYVPAPGKYTIMVNGRQKTINFVIPREVTRDRILASWARQRAVELRPSKLGRRLTVPGIFVIHPTAITGKHNDKYAIYATKKGKRTSKSPLVKGVAVVYAPEEIKDIDDGVLYANTLVHLMPGTYQLAINGTQINFRLQSGESRLIRLGGLAVSGKWPSELKLLQRLSATEKSAMKQPKSSRMFVVAPGKYEIGQQGVVVRAGNAVNFAYDPKKLPGLRKPRLGVRAINDERGGARVTGFVGDSPAASAGLKVGDLILAIDGEKTKTTRDLGMALRQRQYGDSAKFTVRREGRDKALSVTIVLGLKTEAKKSDKDKVEGNVKKTSPAKPGAENSLTLKEFGFKCKLTKKGELKIVEVQKGGAAAKASLQKNDIIKGVEYAQYNPAKELLAFLRDVSRTSKLTLLIKRRLPTGSFANGERIWTVQLTPAKKNKAKSKTNKQGKEPKRKLF